MNWMLEALCMSLVISPAYPDTQDQQVRERARTRAISDMRGITAVKVVVEQMDEEAERAGLTREMLVTASELELRRYGVPVQSTAETTRPKTVAMLYVEVNSLKTSSGMFAYSIDVSLQEAATLARRPDVGVLGEVWSTGQVGVIGPARLRNLREHVVDYVREFANLYLAANPGAARP